MTSIVRLSVEGNCAPGAQIDVGTTRWESFRLPPFLLFLAWPNSHSTKSEMQEHVRGKEGIELLGG